MEATAKYIQNFGRKEKSSFCDLNGMKLIAHEFYMLDHIEENLSQYRKVLTLGASSSEQLMSTLKQFTRMNFMRKWTTIVEPVSATSCTRVTEPGLMGAQDLRRSGGLEKKIETRLFRDVIALYLLTSELLLLDGNDVLRTSL